MRIALIIVGCAMVIILSVLAFEVGDTPHPPLRGPAFLPAEVIEPIRPSPPPPPPPPPPTQVAPPRPAPIDPLAVAAQGLQLIDQGRALHHWTKEMQDAFEQILLSATPAERPHLRRELERLRIELAGDQ